MSYLKGTDVCIGAAMISKPVIVPRPVVRAPVAAHPMSLSIAPHTIPSHVLDAVHVALTPKLTPTSAAAAASTTAIKPSVTPSKAATAATQAVAPKASAAAVSQATASANKLMAAARKAAGKKGGSRFGQHALALAQRSLKNANAQAAAAAHRVMGDTVLGEILGVDWGTIAKTALDPSAWLATQAGTDDAFAAMVEAGSRALDVISQITGHADVVAQGNAIVDSMDALLATAGANVDPTTGSYAGGAASSYGQQAFALLQKENTWENTAAPLAGMGPGTDAPAGGGTTSTGTAPVITSVADQTSGYPTGGNPGDTVLITGSGFTGATAVDFGGMSAPFSVVSDTQITATLPANFPSGNVHVKTAAGTATSPGAFANLQTSASASGPAYGGGGGDFGGGGGGGGGSIDDGSGDYMSADDGSVDESQVDWGDGSQPSDEDQVSARGRGFTPQMMQMQFMPAASTQESEMNPPAPTTPAPSAPIKKTVAERYNEGTDVVTEVLGDDNPGADVTYNDHDTVAAVQKALKSFGFDPGTIDGIYGPKTQRAIKAMQATAGIPQTGVIDYGVLMALKVPAPNTTGTSSAPKSSGGSSGGSYTAGVPRPSAPSASADESVWSRPAWPGAPMKLWQGIVGLFGVGALTFGVVAAVRK